MQLFGGERGGGKEIGEGGEGIRVPRGGFLLLGVVNKGEGDGGGEEGGEGGREENIDNTTVEGLEEVVENFGNLKRNLVPFRAVGGDGEGGVGRGGGSTEKELVGFKKALDTVKVRGRGEE